MKEEQDIVTQITPMKTDKNRGWLTSPPIYKDVGVKEYMYIKCLYGAKC